MQTIVTCSKKYCVQFGGGGVKKKCNIVITLKLLSLNKIFNIMSSKIFIIQYVYLLIAKIMNLLAICNFDLIFKSYSLKICLKNIIQKAVRKADSNQLLDVLESENLYKLNFMSEVRMIYSALSIMLEIYLPQFY